MKIAIVKERREGERRVAATPETAKRFAGLGLEVVVEQAAGSAASFPDEAYRQAGAAIAESAAAALKDADIVLKVQRPQSAAEGNDELSLMRRGALLIAMLSPYGARERIEAYAAAGISAFAMELMPRISRAQSMDVLSSQANLAGYKAVLDAGVQFGKAFPMMMTAAGTVAPAKVIVMGVGVAGLQAIATARRLGAVVSGYDVRPAVKEQVQSLGASFVEVDAAATKEAETAGGYAKEMSEEYKQKQAAVLRETLKKQDIAITTALIPGRPAPVLISEEMVKEMKPGSVIVDLAVEAGGNCPLSEPGQVVVKHGVTIIGYTNYPSRIAVDASALYARNLYNFLAPFAKKEGGGLEIKWDDELVKGTLLTRDGKVVHPSFAAAPTAA
ncbi:MAG TPA: Re/Si-specific NAD(P)(+) transhydrogenase subunit alpha [Alphaproteobacteria bacterium]|nr:Re/Si-specific NAD(P)(+) transhydrogenase subunit alpha [Alphaproteobacteria bacterium]